MGNVTPPNGSSEWTEEKWLDTPRMTRWETSPSFPTSMPQKNITTTTTMTLPGPYQHGSYLPWGGVAPPSPRSIAHSTNSLSTTGVSWPKSTATAPWTSSASRCVARSISLSRRSKWLEWNKASAKGGSRQPEQTIKSTTCDWGKWEPGWSRTALEWTWYARIIKPAMYMGIHSNEGCGVTGLGRTPPL